LSKETNIMMARRRKNRMVMEMTKLMEMTNI
jgi:hypothetical protein